MRNKGSVQFIIVCEDKQQDVFARRFLKLSKVERHNIYTKRCQNPKTAGDAKQWIKTNLPAQLQGFKSYNAKNKSTARVLLVIADADDKTVEQRIKHVTSGCSPKPNPNENVCFIIPKWAIETWIMYLRDGSADESYQIRSKDKLQRQRDCWPQVEKLKDMCDSSALLPDSAPDSLLKACTEFQRIRSVLQSYGP